MCYLWTATATVAAAPAQGMHMTPSKGEVSKVSGRQHRTCVPAVRLTDCAADLIHTSMDHHALAVSLLQQSLRTSGGVLLPGCTADCLPSAMDAHALTAILLQQGVWSPGNTHVTWQSAHESSSCVHDTAIPSIPPLQLISSYVQQRHALAARIPLLRNHTCTLHPANCALCYVVCCVVCCAVAHTRFHAVSPCRFCCK